MAKNILLKKISECNMELIKHVENSISLFICV